MNIVTIDKLSIAIKEKLDIDTLEAKKFANIVMDFFGYEDRIIDNSLNQKDRKLFYRLQTQGLLFTERERITLPNGRQWRIHYWLLAKKNIFKYSNNQFLKEKYKNGRKSLSEDVYSYISNDNWLMRKNSAF